MSMDAPTSDPIINVSGSLEATENQTLESHAPKSTIWEGRKWAILGPHNNLPPFIHLFCALPSAIFESSKLALASIGQFKGIQGVLGHGSRIFENCRDLIDYTGFINLTYRTITEGPLHFVSRENVDGKEQINWMETASNACYVAIDILFPFDFLSSRMQRAEIGNTASLATAKDFINNGFPVTKFLTAAGTLWGVATGISFAINVKDFTSSVHKAVKEEMNSNKNYTFSSVVYAGWNKGATWDQLNKLQVGFVGFGFALLNGGIVPFPAGALTKACALAFKGGAALNAITQTFLGGRIKEQANAA